MNWRALTIVSLLACPATAFSQPYASANLGWARADFPLGEPFNGYADDRSVTYGLDLGIGFGERWAAQLGFNGYGDFDGRGSPCVAGTICTGVVSDQSIEQMVYNASIVRRFTIKELRFFAKAGYYHAEIDTDVGGFDEDGLVLGAGIRWYFDSPWSVSLEASRFDDNVSQFVVGFGWGLGLGGSNRDDSASE
jgi:outer membrane protein with beta-barrel domain